MMRITREEEQYIGGARPAVHGRVKAGFGKDGRITALDMFVISENGPYEAQGDTALAGRSRLAAVPAGGDAVARRVGADQHAAAPRAEPAGRDAGQRGDGADAREGGAQARHRPGGHPPHQRAGRQGAVRAGRTAGAARRTATSAFVKEALDKGAELFRVGGAQGAGGKRRDRRCAASASPSARSSRARPASTG